jgi:hypothetical protein
MSTEVQHVGEHQHQQHDLVKPEKEGPQMANEQSTNANNSGSQQHPLHTYDLKVMSKFYESCIGKMSEQNPRLRENEWMNAQAMPNHLSWEQKYDWPNPYLFGEKQKIYESFARLARESGEPMVLMPNFDFSDMMNFEKFLESLKLDGVNAIGKYKQYLNGRDIKKLEIDLVVVHPRYGIMLVDIKESDHFDNKRRSRARAQLREARIAFESVIRLILESKGLKPSDCHLPISLYVALPNVRELPQQMQKTVSTVLDQQNTSTTSIGSGSSASTSRTLNYLIKSDLDDQCEFTKWWNRSVVEPKQNEEQQKQQQQQQQQQNGENKEEEKMKKTELVNLMLGLINCIRNNSILPVVYPETGMENGMFCENGEQNHSSAEPNQPGSPSTSDKEENQNGEKSHFQPALNVYAEFFRPEHEKARSLSKVVVISKDSERIRKTICLQTLWLLLNDSQKKISVVCSESNKPYYEEFFARQRKVYNNLNNVRFYVDIHSCDPSQHTIKRDGEIWFFDINTASMDEIIKRAKDLNSFWIFSDQQNQVNEFYPELDKLNSQYVHLDEENYHEQQQHNGMQSLSSMGRIKLPLRLQCDLLVIGDLIGLGQLKYLYKLLKNNSVPNQASMYQSGNQHHQHHQQQQPQYQQLRFNPVKKFRQIKFIRGGTIDNLRNSLKMHDSINAPVIFMHVGDEDLFKTRNSVAAIERVKELTTLVKEYCPKSFVVLSTLMRRQSRTENNATNEVNKGITTFCRQTRDTLNCYYMLNNHFEPDYHTQGGRLLTPKGLRLFADNILFVVDHFLIRNNKQH